MTFFIILRGRESSERGRSKDFYGDVLVCCFNKFEMGLSTGLDRLYVVVIRFYGNVGDGRQSTSNGVGGVGEVGMGDLGQHASYVASGQ